MRQTRALFLLATLALLGGACSSSKQAATTSASTAVATASTTGQISDSSAVGVTPDSITVGLSAPFSGVYGPVISQLVDGAFVTWSNDVNASGGINGRRVILKKVDNKNTADGAAAACKEDQSNGTFMTVIITGVSTEADCLNQAHDPVLLELSADTPPASWTYAHVISSSAQVGQSLATFVKNVMQDGTKKLGVIYLNTQPEAKDIYVDAAKGLGMNVVDSEAISPNQATFTAQLVRLKNAGAQNVAVFAGSEVIGILRDAKALSYQPDFTGGLWASDTFSGAAQSLMDGIKGLYLATTVDSPAYPSFSAKAKAAGQSTVNRDVMGQYGVALVVGKVLEAAGKTPTRGSLLTGINTIKNYDNQIIPPVTWGPGVVIGSLGWWPESCCNADHTWKSLGPPKENF
jgi:branched-chain amino acid transport system substrate-binding protein